jgi:PAS domain S-box-containing protein
MGQMKTVGTNTVNKPSLASLPRWDIPITGGHSVQFYEDDAFLLDGLSRFIGAAIAAGDSALVVASKAHCDGLSERLSNSGLDLTKAAQQGRFVAADAAETLARFMENDHPNAARFEKEVGGIVAQLTGTNGKRQRLAIFGEMVALLWAEGKQQAAIELERLWNRLAEKREFQLHCAYPLNLFSHAQDAAAIEKICSEHSHVAPAERYSTLKTDEARMAAIAVLQQKAQALETEIHKREKVQAALKKREMELSDFLENAVLAMHWVGADGTILWANPAELSLLGYSPEEYIGHSITEFHADQEVIGDILQRLARHEELHGCNARLRCKDGSVRQVRIHSNVFTEKGEFVHTRCFTVDVTEAERSERRIAAQHAITRLLSEANSLEEVGDAILEAICGSSECDMGAIWQVEGEKIRCVRTWHTAQSEFNDFESLTRRTEFERGVGLPGRIWATNQPAWIEEVSLDPNLPRLPVAIKQGFRSALGFPISTNRGAVGMIEFFSREARKTDAEFMKMMAAVGNQIGQFIERKEAERALRENEEFLRTVIETTPECVKIVAKDGKILRMNSAGLAMLGADSADMVIGKSAYDVIAPEDRDRFREFNERICRGESGSLEFEIVGLNGVRRQMESQATPLRNVDGSLVQLAVARDVTERRRAEQALRESEQMLRVVSDASPILVWMSGTDKLCYYFNKGWLDFVGRTLEQESGNGWAENVHPDDFDHCLQIYVSSFDARRTFEMEYRLRHHSGQYRWIMDRGVPRYAADGTFEGYVGGCLDIHDQKEAREQLRRNQEQLRNAFIATERLAAIVESSDDAIASKDLNGIVTSWNKSAEKMFGYKAEEIIGQPVTLIIPPELHKDEDMILGKIRRGEKIAHFETERVTKNGDRIDVSLTISPVKDSSGTVIGAAKIVRNITEKKKIERALLTTEKLAAAGRLAATVAHEINNPLEAVTNLVYLAKRDMPESSKAGAHLNMASRELDRVAHIARQTLGFYRDTSSPVRFNVTHTIDELLLLYEKRFESRNVKVIKQYRGKIEITALVGELRQALSNLITNALDAMPHGGSLVIRVSPSHAWNNSGMAGVRITIMDTGSGIAPQHRKQIFQPFFTTKEDVGTGLGLWITRNLLEKHHGMIQVKSRTEEDRHGTAFSIFLPQEVKLGPRVSPTEAA